MALRSLSTPEDIPERSVGTVQLAHELRCTRATIKRWILSGALPAVKIDGRWYIKEEDLGIARELEAHMHRWSNSDRVSRPRRLIAGVLYDWDDATVSELAAAAIDLHPGNIRKHLALLGAEGHATRDEHGSWRLTEAGRTWFLGTAQQIDPEYKGEVTPGTS